MRTQKTFHIEAAAKAAGVDYRILLDWIENEWIVPAEKTVKQLDEEDIARARLIQDLKVQFNVNDESISIILHLLDQLHHLHYQLRRFRLREGESA